MRRNRPDRSLGAEKGSMVFWYDPQLWVVESIFSETWWCMGQKGGSLSAPKSKPNRRGAKFARRR